VVFRPDLVKEMEEKVHRIRHNLGEAQARQKNYADKRRWPLIFQVGNHMYLKVSPMKEMDVSDVNLEPDLTNLEYPI
jgi:hypothetical protein